MVTKTKTKTTTTTTASSSSSSIRSSTDIANLLEREHVKETDSKLMSQVIETLVAAVPQPTPQQLLHMNRGLIHVLQIIDQAPNGQISTRKLLETINSGDLHKLIKKGEELGFIERKKVKNPKGQKGNNMVVNSLSPMGYKLLELSDGYFGRASRRR
jgi:hypothetical protein